MRTGLHRVGKRPDWDRRPRRRWNIWQRIAGNTGGWLTLGNLLTFIGLILVLIGLANLWRGAYGWALAYITVGRVCDLLDGWLANRTRTKSPLGELLDASVDKLETGLTLIVLVGAGLLPWPAAVLTLLPQLVITRQSFRAWRVGKRLHPSRSGKLAMALVWVALGGMVLLAILLPTSNLAYWLAYVLASGAAVAGMAAFWDYQQPADD
jgi:phosphatidylglycerophosphate synthase